MGSEVFVDLIRLYRAGSANVSSHGIPEFNGGQSFSVGIDMERLGGQR